LLDDTEALLKHRGLTAYYGMSMAHVARGKLLEGQGRLREADEALAQGIELARRGDAKFDVSYGLLTHAEVKGGLGDRRAAKGMLQEARQTAEACADPGVLPELVARVERRLRLVPSRATRTPYEEDLSDRELAVLRLLATDLTQREIGQALYVSFNRRDPREEHLAQAERLEDAWLARPRVKRPRQGFSNPVAVDIRNPPFEHHSSLKQG